LLICDETLGWIEHALRGVDVSDEALAVDLIDEVGPDGQFLDSKHTLTHFRDRWYPSLMDRDNHAGWQVRGGTTLQERAAERVEEILGEHRAEPLDEDVAQAVHAIVQRAEAEYA
jgi:trimethylamine--corrinoid protein Co-methyltransferase